MPYNLKLIEEFIIPRCSGKGFIVKKGQVMRVIEIGGGQVADIKFLNADNYEEQFSAVGSMMLNGFAGVEGSYFRMEHMYSKVPWENLMMTVLDDKVGANTFGAHCSHRLFEMIGESGKFGLKGGKGHRSCTDNFIDALGEFGIDIKDTENAGVFNVFMPRPIDKDGNATWVVSPAKDGDYVDFRAEMNILVAYSNCPCGPPINPEGNEDMKVEIYG